MHMQDTGSLPAGNLTQRLDHFAMTLPEVNAFNMLTSELEISGTLTFSELQIRSTMVAGRLAARGVVSGDRVVIAYPTGHDFLEVFFGCLRLGAIAVPVYPPTRHLDTLATIIEDCTPKIIAVDVALDERLKKRFDGHVLFQSYSWVNNLTDPGSAEAQFKPAEAIDQPIALLQYTSGSTGQPKGVIVSHANLEANLDQIRDTYGVNTDTVCVSWLPLYHDMGLIGNLLSVVHNGAQIYLMRSPDFLKNPLSWLRAISKFRATICGAPNFAYQLCCDRVTNVDLDALDLSSWQVAVNGAEPVRPSVMDAFAERFGTVGFQRHAFSPSYGLAEATLLISACGLGAFPRISKLRKKALADDRAISVGRSDRDAICIASMGCVVAGHDVAIVDTKTRTCCPDGNVGEVWIAGPSVSEGYWNRTAEAEPLPADIGEMERRSEGQFLNTGDLGFMRDDELYITGRKKDVIIIRGRNYYPSDVELAVTQADAAFTPDGTAAIEVDIDGAPALVIVQEINRSAVRRFDAASAATAVRGAVLNEFEIDVAATVFVPPRTIPRTSSGKIQHQGTKAAYLADNLKVLAVVKPGSTSARDAKPEGDPLVWQLRVEVAGALKTNPSEVVVDKAIYDLGIDSLSQLELAFRLEQKFGISVEAEEIFDGITITDLAARINESGKATAMMGTDQTHAGTQGATSAIHPPSEKEELQFSLMYFSSDAEPSTGLYDFIFDSSTFADAEGFTAVWLPERHFHRFGGLFPNPSIVASAIAARTKNIRIRAGSVILPLHEPIRVAEEWSVVDNISGGRVDLSFGQGWNPNDFALAPNNFGDRLERMYDGIDDIHKLWKGGSVSRPNGVGKDGDVSIYPKPIQSKLDVWMTCSSAIERFQEAGAADMNILTALLFQKPEELAEKIAAYRQARADAGHDPDAGHVTLMLHTYVGSEMSAVRDDVRGPLTKYLRDSIDLWRQKSDALENLDEAEESKVLDFAFERYFRQSALCGTVESCRAVLAPLMAAGVNEIACLVDFGVAQSKVKEALPHLAALKHEINVTQKIKAVGA